METVCAAVPARPTHKRTTDNYSAFSSPPERISAKHGGKWAQVRHQVASSLPPRPPFAIPTAALDAAAGTFRSLSGG